MTYVTRRWRVSTLLGLCAVMLSGDRARATQSVQGATLILKSTAKAAVGDHGGPRQPRFASVTADGVSERGQIVVLDGLRSTLKVFDAKGVFLFEAPGARSAAGRRPVALALEGTGAAVLDAADNKIRLFTVLPNGVTLRSTFAVAAAPESMCRAAGKNVVSSTSAHPLIHVYDDSGKLVRSFGERLPGSANEPNAVRERKSNLSLVCAAGESIIAVSRSLGTIDSYSPEGVHKWRVQLDDFFPYRIRWHGDTILTEVGERYDTVVGVTRITSEVIAVQIARRDSAMIKAHAEPTIETRYVATADGKSVGRQLHVAIIKAASDKDLFLLPTESVPTVRVVGFEFRR
jgi:hypothetical protein